MKKIITILALVGCFSCAPSRLNRNVNIEENEIEPTKTSKPSLMDFLSRQRSLVDYREIYGYSKEAVSPKAPQVHQYHQEKSWRRRKPVESNTYSTTTQINYESENSIINDSTTEPKKPTRRLPSRRRRPTVSSTSTHKSTELSQNVPNSSTTAAIPTTSIHSRRRRPTASIPITRATTTTEAINNALLSTTTTNKPLNKKDLQQISSKGTTQGANVNINEQIKPTTQNTTSTSNESTTENDLHRKIYFNKSESTNTKPIQMKMNTTENKSSTSTNPLLVDETTDLSLHSTLVDLGTTDFTETSTQLTFTIDDFTADTNEPIFSTTQGDFLVITTEIESKPSIKLSESVNVDSESSTSTNPSLVDETTNLYTHSTIVNLNETDFTESTTPFTSTIDDFSTDTNEPLVSTTQADFLEINTKSESKPTIKLSKAVNLDSSKNEISLKNVNPLTIDNSTTYPNNVTSENVHEEITTYSESTDQTTTTDENLIQNNELTTQNGFTEVTTYTSGLNTNDVESYVSTISSNFDIETNENNTKNLTTQSNIINEELNNLNKATTFLNSLVTQAGIETTTEFSESSTYEDSFTTNAMETKPTSLFQIIVKDDLDSKNAFNSISKNLSKEPFARKESKSLENNNFVRNNATKPITLNINILPKSQDGKIDVVVMADPHLNAFENKPDKKQVSREGKTLSSNFRTVDSNNSIFNEPIVVAETNDSDFSDDNFD